MRTFVVVLALVAGCDPYLPHGPEDDICEEPAPIAGVDLRDPATGNCQAFGSDCGCGQVCGVVVPNWGACESSCSGLDETTCLARPGCQAAFILPISEPAGLPPITPAFTGCWATPNPAIEGGTCDGLTSDACSRRDDCGAVYIGPTGAQEFAQCIPEPNCGTSTCTADQHCVPECDACDGLPHCVPNQACDTLATEGGCTLRTDCVPVYAGTDCTCTPSGCTCTTETYERCESAPAP